MIILESHQLNNSPLVSFVKWGFFYAQRFLKREGKMTSNKFKVYFIVSVAFVMIIQLHSLSRADDQTINKSTEKPISIKGLSIGMNVNDARNTVINLLGKDYLVTPVGNSEYLLRDNKENQSVRFGNRETFKTGSGFFIQGIYGHNRGFISADGKDAKVTRICLSGIIIDFLYSSSEVKADHFVKQFESDFGLPGLPWVPYGWSYSSPNGYMLTIMTDKLIDIKKIDFQVAEKNKNIEF